jgi:hypothetical protein
MLLQIFIIIVLALLALRFYFNMNGKNGFGKTTDAMTIAKNKNLSGKVIVITGCNTGIKFL